MGKAFAVYTVLIHIHTILLSMGIHVRTRTESIYLFLLDLVCQPRLHLSVLTLKSPIPEHLSTSVFACLWKNTPSGDTHVWHPVSVLTLHSLYTNRQLREGGITVNPTRKSNRLYCLPPWSEKSHYLTLKSTQSWKWHFSESGMGWGHHALYDSSHQ